MSQSKSQGSGIKFVALGNRQKHTKIALLLSSSAKVEVWEKGQEQKVISTALAFDQEKEFLTIKIDSQKFSKKNPILLHFVLHNVHFFSRVTLEKIKNDSLVVSVKADFYRLENRKSFRLMMYPAILAYLQIEKKNEENNLQENNVLQFRKNKESLPWDMAQQFAEIVRPEILRFKLQDISIEGFSIGIEKDVLVDLKKGKKLKNLNLHWGDQIFDIKEAEVAYSVSKISSAPNPSNIVNRIGFVITKIAEVESLRLKEKIKEVISRLNFGEDFEEFVEK